MVGVGGASKSHNKRRKLGRIDGKNQPTERSKGGFTYTLLFGIFGVSFRDEGRGAPQNFKTDFENPIIRPVFHR